MCHLIKAWHFQLCRHLLFFYTIFFTLHCISSLCLQASSGIFVYFTLRCISFQELLVLRAVPGCKEFVTFKFYDLYPNILHVSQTFCNISSAKIWSQKYRQIIVIRLKVWFSQPLCLDRNPVWLLNYNKVYLICVFWAFTIVHFVWLWLFSLLQHSIQKINLTYNWKTIYEL